MKLRYLLLVSLLIIFSISLQSQTLVKENNLWSNLLEVTPGNFTFHYQVIKGDTTIDSKSYKKLMGTSSSSLTNWNYEAALREPEPGKIYSKKVGATTEHLLYDFTIAVNDTFTGFYNECQYKLIVNSIENKILMNGETRKEYNLRVVTTGFAQENWIQEIGSDNGLTSAGVYACTADIYPTLNCFTEDGIVKVYNNADFPCYSLVELPAFPAAYASHIVPNPVNDIATIQLQESNLKDLTLLILNSHGRESARYQSDSSNRFIINRKGLPGGIYFYEIYSGPEKISNGKFVIK